MGEANWFGKTPGYEEEKAKAALSGIGFAGFADSDEAFNLKSAVALPIMYTRVNSVFQLVRRAKELKCVQQPNAGEKNVAGRGNFLSTALLTVLSVNVFMLSGVISFCTFTFWYAQ